ncbi:MAG: ATP phosphoribosyltransferase regulatory subunit [Vicinamibacteria bacterium]
MSGRSLLEIPSGVQCFFGEEALLRREVERRVSDVFRGWCYEEIVLPLFDFDCVFTRGGGSSDGIYRFIGRDGEVMALRPDFTALAAKVVVSRLSRHELPLRLFYSGEVLRYQPPRAGRQEELFQIGLEHLGGNGVESDVEVILVAGEALSSLGIEDAVLTLGDVGFALRLLRELESRPRALEALDAMRRRDRDGIGRILGPARSGDWFELMGLSGGIEVLDEARRLPALSRENRALERLERTAGLLRELGFAKELRIDLGEVRGFDYYTGLVFEIHAAGSGLELGGGGRYDSLLGRFGRELPAVGFYLSLDRISELLARRGFFPKPPESASVGSLAEALEARLAGKNVKVGSSLPGTQPQTARAERAEQEPSARAEGERSESRSEKRWGWGPSALMNERGEP